MSDNNSDYDPIFVDVSIFTGIKRWFFWPWKKHLWIFISITSLLAIVITIRSIRLGPKVQRGLKLYFAKLAILQNEISRETHPNDSEMRKQHLEMVKKYASHLTSQQCMDVVRFLYPSYRPEKSLKEAISSLESKKIQNNKAVAFASTQLLSISISTLKKMKIPSSESMEQCTPWKISPDRREDIESSLDDCIQITDLLKQNPNYDNALESCLACRRTILLLLLDWGYNSDRIKTFRECVLKSRDVMRSLINSGKYTGDKLKDLKTWSESENFRLLIIDEMIKGDIDTVVKLLKKAIETSVTE